MIEQFKQLDGVVNVTPQEQFRGQTTLKLNRLEGFASIYGIDPQVIPDLGFTMAQGTAALGPSSVIVGSGVGSSFGPPGSGGSRRGIGLGALFGAGPQAQSTESANATPAPDLYGQSIQLVMQRNNNGQQETRTVRLFVSGVLASTGGEQDYNIYMSLNDVANLTAWSQGKRPNWTQDGYSQVLVIAKQDATTTLNVTDEITNLGYFTRSTTSIVQNSEQHLQCDRGGAGRHRIYRVVRRRDRHRQHDDHVGAGAHPRDRADESGRRAQS